MNQFECCWMFWKVETQSFQNHPATLKTTQGPMRCGGKRPESKSGNSKKSGNLEINQDFRPIFCQYH